MPFELRSLAFLEGRPDVEPAKKRPTAQPMLRRGSRRSSARSGGGMKTLRYSANLIANGEPKTQKRSAPRPSGGLRKTRHIDQRATKPILPLSEEFWSNRNCARDAEASQSCM